MIWINKSDTDIFKMTEIEIRMIWSIIKLLLGSGKLGISGWEVSYSLSLAIHCFDALNLYLL